jgi:hypothetical protein
MTHKPEKSGMDAGFWEPPPAAPAGTTVCPPAGVAIAAANINNEMNSRCPYMPTSIRGRET